MHYINTSYRYVHMLAHTGSLVGIPVWTWETANNNGFNPHMGYE